MVLSSIIDSFAEYGERAPYLPNIYEVRILVLQKGKVKDDSLFKEIEIGSFKTGMYTKVSIATIRAIFSDSNEIKELVSVRKWRWASNANRWLPIKGDGICFEIKHLGDFKRIINSVEE